MEKNIRADFVAPVKYNVSRDFTEAHLCDDWDLTKSRTLRQFCKLVASVWAWIVWEGIKWAQQYLYTHLLLQNDIELVLTLILDITYETI